MHDVVLVDRHQLKGRSMKWVRPRLVVLARPSSEERVLETCKSEDWVVHGPGDGYSECETKDYCYAVCEPMAVS